MQSPDGANVEQQADVLAAELAAEARRRVEAEAVVEELSQYNTAVIEQAQARVPDAAALAAVCNCFGGWNLHAPPS